MATILNNQKSTGGSPYAYYTITAEYSNRTTFGVTISGTISGHLASSSSSLGTGQSMGLNVFLTLNGIEQTGVNIKSTGTGWSGTTSHSVNYSFTISNLQPTQVSVPISVRVSRTGSAENNYSYGASLKSTACSALDIPQGVGQSTFNSITNTTTNGVFSLSITSYSGYDVLTIKNGNTTIKTISGVTNGTNYSFTSSEQSTLVSAIGSNSTSINLTAILETFVSNGGASLGSTSKTMNVALPAYTPTITLSSYSDSISTYNTYKNNATDIIKGISKPTIVVTVSDNYNNTYTAASCNGTAGTINGRTITFATLNQTNTYSISVTDSRNKVGTLSIDGSNYSSTIKTVQWYKGSLATTVVRPSPTGTTALVKVTPNIYDGTNLKTSALLGGDFTLKYTQNGSSEVSRGKSYFSESGGEYTYTITGLDPTKIVNWSISGTDKIGVATNGDSGTLGIGLPVFNAYKDNSGNQFMKINGTLDINSNSALVIRKTGNNILRNNSGGATILSSAGTTDNNIWFRPNGDNNQTNQTYIDTSGVYHGNIDGNSNYANSCNASNVLSSHGTDNGCLSYQQTPDSYFGSASGWAHYIIGNHGEGSTYFNYMIRLPFWEPPQYQRQMGDTSTRTGWVPFKTLENGGVAVMKGMTGDMTLSNGTLTKLNMTNLNQTGWSRFSAYNNGIKIGEGVSKVLVSGQAYFTTMSGSNCITNLYIHINSVDDSHILARSVLQSNYNYRTMVIAPQIVDVNEGDTIYLSGKTQNSNMTVGKDGWCTYLCVQQVQ